MHLTVSDIQKTVLGAVNTTPLIMHHEGDPDLFPLTSIPSFNQDE